MGIDLRRRNVGVSEHFLDNAQVGAAGQKMGCEAMPEKVGIDICFETCARRVTFDELPNALWRQLSSPHRQEYFGSRAS